MIGVLYLVSAMFLTVVVAVVYSAAQEAFAPPERIARQALRRMAKLAGVLAGLALVVFFLSGL